MIRYDNLDALVKARNWGPSDLARATGRSTNQCGDMLRRQKSFGEKLARNLEQKLDLPRGWFDQIHDEKDPHFYAAPAAKPLVAAEPDPAQMALTGYSQSHDLSGTSWVRAPLIEWAHLGGALYIANDEWPLPTCVSAATTITPHGNRFKAVSAPDDSLSPRIVKGDVLILDPDHRQPKPNQVVLIALQDGSLLIRRFMPLADGTFEVYDSSGRSLDSARHGLQLVATAIGMLPHDL